MTPLVGIGLAVLFGAAVFLVVVFSTAERAPAPGESVTDPQGQSSTTERDAVGDGAATATE